MRLRVYARIRTYLENPGLPHCAAVPLCTGTFVDARVIGVLDMADEKGQDAKLLAVVHADPRFDEITDLTDIQEHVKIEIQHFFETYKSLEKNKWSKVQEGHGGRVNTPIIGRR